MVKYNLVIKNESLKQIAVTKCAKNTHFVTEIFKVFLAYYNVP